MRKAKILTLHAYTAARQHADVVAGSVIVLACAAALILAGQPMPL